MPITHYSIVQLVPDFIADERVNIGILVFADDGKLHVRTLRSWERAKRFAGQSAIAAREFIQNIESNPNAAISLEQAMDGAREWHHGVQLTQPQPSTLPPAKLLADLAPRFLRDDDRDRDSVRLAKMPYRTRSVAVNVAYHALHQVIGKYKVLRKKMPHSGRRGQHQFDIGALNGRLYFLAQAISFENPDEEKVSKDLDAASWRFEDVRSIEKDLTLAAFALVSPQQSNSPLFEQAKKNFDGLNVEILTEDNLADWSRGMAERIDREVF